VERRRRRRHGSVPKEDILLGPERTTHTLPLGGRPVRSARGAGFGGAVSFLEVVVSGARPHLATKLVFQTGSQKSLGFWVLCVGV